MSVPVAYVSIIIIWSTTPLAIQWSSAEWGFLFGVSGRMTIGLAICLAIIALQRKRILWNKPALHTYLAALLGVYGAMLSVYWGAQYIPSGLVAVLYGLSPIVTGIVASLWLGENALTPGKIAGALLGIAGLATIFRAEIEGHTIAWQGIAGVLLSVLFHAVSGVWVKRINAKLPALTITTGCLLLATPLYALTWYFVDGNPPRQIPMRSGLAMLYLGAMATVVGFSLYFYVLKHIEANRVALITLVTPVLALLLGQTLNHEQISPTIALGACLIVVALSWHQWADSIIAWFRTRFFVGVKESAAIEQQKDSG